jgi:benzoyl-CoA 2,3-dioxygenase component B
VSLRNAMNEVMRASYIKDCEIGVKRWNMQIQRAGYEFRLALPSPRFRRSIGAWANVPTDLQGQPIGREDMNGNCRWLPSEADRSFVAKLDAARRRARQDGRLDRTPDRGINNLPVEYDYVRLS